MARLARRGRSNVDIWPGFVDALGALLIAFMFLLMVFVIAQVSLSEVLSGKDQALDRLNREVAQLADLLALEEQANQDLQAAVASLSSELQSTLSDRDRLSEEARSLRDLSDMMTSRLAELQDEADRTEAERSRLASVLAETEALLARREAALAASEEQLSDREATLEETLALLANRNAELEATTAKLADRETLLAAAEAALAESQADLDERIKALEEASKQLLLTDAALKQAERAYADSAAELARRMKELEDANRTIAADKETIELQLRKLAELEQDIVAMEAYRAELEQQLQTMMAKTKSGEEDLTREREISAAAKAQLALLNRQLAELRSQIAALNDALEASEARDKEQKAQIVDLGKRLNAALASKVQELARYRSEFFGRLRDVLGDRSDIRIVGDRFVFQSEVLFASGEAELGQAGRQQMAALARTLRDIAQSIPADVNWILRVDGHTDRQPINTDRFPSNWELSTARAISVVRFLQRQGIPPDRLAATGFGEYQPIAEGETIEVLRRNRRIELKLDQR